MCGCFGAEECIMQIEYQRDLKDHYLVLHGTQKLAADAYQIHMIQENRLSGFTECHTELVDDEIRYSYRITSMQSLEELTAVKPAGVQMLRNLFRSLAEALQELEAYLLNQNDVLLSPAFIFSDALQQNFLFCYYPEHNISIDEGMKELSEYLLPHLDERDRAAVMLGFSFYQTCASGEMTEMKLKELLFTDGNKNLNGPEKKTDQRQTAEEAGYIMPLKQLSPEELRAQILDDFFSDEEEADAVRKSAARRRLIWFLMMTALALGTAAVLVLQGWKQTGLGAAVLVEAAAIFFWRMREKFKRLRNHIHLPVKREKDTEKFSPWYEEVDSNWNTYKERAAELEVQDRTAESYSVEAGQDNEILSGFGKEALAIFGREELAQPGAGNLSPTGYQSPTGYEETIWLEENGSDTAAVLAWLEKTGENRYKSGAGQNPGTGNESSRIILTEEIHVIGKNPEACDILADSAAVSRIHAHLIRRDEGYVILDMRSRNGTFLNGLLLDAGKTYLLHDGDEIRCADVTYQYYLQ